MRLDSCPTLEVRSR